MIRMGRSNRSDEPAETPTYQETYGGSQSSGYVARQENVQPVPGRGAVSESESMARDIKEGRLSGFVGHGTVLTGETTFHAMLRVDGHLTGRVTSENGTLIVGTNGRVDANILVAVAVVHGTINGDIVALEKIELGRSASVTGNIQTPRLTIEDGAVFEGGCTMLKAREASEQRTAEATRQPTNHSPMSESSFEEESDEESLAAADESPEEVSEAVAS